MNAVDSRAAHDVAGSAHGGRLSLVVALLAATAAPSLALGTAAQPHVPPGPLQTGPTAELTVTPNPANPGEVVTLDATNSTSPNSDIESCEFDVDGDGTYDETRQDCLLETTYQAEGEYNTTVRVRTTQDLTDTDSVLLTVAANEPPTAAIAVDPAEPEPGDAVQLSGADSTDADGQIESYFWELPNDQLSGETVETSFADPGEYTVELTVVDDDGAQNTTTEVITVAERNDPPTARLSVATAEPTVGEPVELDASGSTDPEGSLDVYAWDFDGDDRVDRTTEEPGTSYVPETAGSASVTVTAIDEGGASDTATVRFDVAEAATERPEPTPTVATATATPDGGGGVLGGLDLGLLPLVPDLLGLLLLLVLVAGGAAVSVRRREAVAEQADRLRELLMRGDIRRRIAKKLSGTTVKTAAKNAVKRFSDLIEAGGEALGEAVERVGRAIKRGSRRVAEWLRQLGA